MTGPFLCVCVCLSLSVSLDVAWSVKINLFEFLLSLNREETMHVSLRTSHTGTREKLAALIDQIG